MDEDAQQLGTGQRLAKDAAQAAGGRVSLRLGRVAVVAGGVQHRSQRADVVRTDRDDRNVPGMRVAPQFGEHAGQVDRRRIDVEQDQVGMAETRNFQADQRTR